jgi:8-oxo-dGTP pyrophosphatase MutT (NUDIX family)
MGFYPTGRGFESLPGYQAQALSLDVLLLFNSYMAHYEKVGLLVLSDDDTRFLVCEKEASNMTADYIMPGGQFTEETVEDCLREEIAEELGCEVDFSTLEHLGRYTDIAAGDPNSDVSIELYRGEIIGEPKPTTEIKKIHKIGKEDQNNERVSKIIRNKI